MLFESDGGDRVEPAVEDQRVYVARLNIEHFRRKLATEQDAALRQTLLGLLAEEEAKLAGFTTPKKDTLA